MLVLLSVSFVYIIVCVCIQHLRYTVGHIPPDMPEETAKENLIEAIDTYIKVYLYIYIGMCICVCMCVICYAICVCVCVCICICVSCVYYMYAYAVMRYM